MLVPLKVETIIECLNHDSSEWDTLATQYSNKEDFTEVRLSNDKVKEIYDKSIIKATQLVTFDHMVEISKSMGIDAEQYRHCNYQVAIAASVASHDHPFIIVTAPTGSGKTWM